MKKLNNLKWFTLGLIVCLLITTLIVPAFASQLTKSANLIYNNIKITLNGNAVTPKDVNGNTVEPFTIDGTTYLPVRAISTALGLGVYWDGANKTVKLTDGVTKTEKAQITEIRNWVVGDIWNVGFCDLYHYLEDGKSSCGTTMDVNFTLQQLEKSMSKKSVYDAYMSTISNSELAELWLKVSGQIDVLYADVKSRDFSKSGQSLDTGLYEQYFSVFDKVYYNLP